MDKRVRTRGRLAIMSVALALALAALGMWPVRLYAADDRARADALLQEGIRLYEVVN